MQKEIFGNIDIEAEKKCLKDLIKEAFCFGSFKMKDGTDTSFYVNGQMITSNPFGLYTACRIILEHLYEWDIKGVCGEVSGASPLIGGVIMLSHLYGKPLNGIYIRKEIRQNGMQSFCDIAIPDSIPLAMVDDVSSSGMTALRCQKILKEKGAEVKGVITVIDRNRGAKKCIEGAGMNFKTLFLVDDFSEYIEKQLQGVNNGF